MNNPGNTTLVTALYDIGRDNLTGIHAHRKFSKYLNWFKNLLLINVPMIIFIPPELHSYVSEHRNSKYDTKIIIRKFEELIAYQNYHNRIQNTINTMTKEPDTNGSIPKHFSDCPEFITAKYETIIFSKFDFLKEASDDNPFNTDYFIWLDAGTFYNIPSFDYESSWPDPYKIKIIKDRFLVSNYSFDVNNKRGLTNKREYLRLNQNDICAYILGGNKGAIDRIHKLFWNEVNNALNIGVINNEQHILQLMVLENPEYYYIWYQTRHKYPKYECPLRDRMIPCELAKGTFVGEHYAINPNVRLLTLATREIHKKTYKRWKNTARHFGYQYEILGRKEPWQGFNTKIRLFKERLQTVTEPYTVLTDGTDLFFCATADELYDKFIKSGKNIIVGGELKIYYPGGKLSTDAIYSHFDPIRESEHAYPNSGFIIGKTEYVKRLMEINSEYNDDQVACFDAIYHNKIDLVIDYKTEFVGNVAYYTGVEYFGFDDKVKRYKNMKNNEYPVAFHFPGKNLYMMKEFYNNCQFDMLDTPEDAPGSAGWIYFGVIIVLLIIMLIVVYSTPYSNRWRF